MECKNMVNVHRGKTVIVTLDRAERLNALSDSMKCFLEDLIQHAEMDDEIGGIIITGAGRAFCAGNDVDDESKATAYELVHECKRMQTLFGCFEALNKPIIAAINGYALGGGCELALACDIRIAAEEAVFGLPEVKLGALPGFGGTQRLPRVVGTAWAKEIILTGRNVKADEALLIGLVNKVVPQEELLNTAVTMMEQILKNSPKSVGCGKYVINNGIETTLQEGIKYELKAIEQLVSTEDYREGVAAFIEKRTPTFTGR